MRAFIALELPTEFADDAAALARRLSASLEGRFLDRDTYHLTLAFLGDIDDGEAGRAMDALDAVCAAARPGGTPGADAAAFFGDPAAAFLTDAESEAPGPIVLAPDGLGKFGRPADATLWLGIAPAPPLMALAERLRDELAARAVPFDPKPFRPHITLARRVRIPKKPLPDLAFPLPAEARAVTLFKSTLSRDGAAYKPLYTRELG